MTPRYRIGDTPVTDAEALKVACPECGAVPDSPCVYVWPKGVNPDTPHRSPGVQARVDRVGTPTGKAHNARRTAAHSARRRPKTPPVSVRISLTAGEVRDILASTTIHDGTREKLEEGLWRLTGETK